MDHAGLTAAVGADSRALAAAAARAPDADVATCPGWSMPELVRHVGGVHRWCAAIVSSGGRVDRSAMPVPAPDTTVDGLVEWLVEGADELCAVFDGADGDSTTWTFSGVGDRRVRWWVRRQASETSVHRWDAEHAAAPGAEGPIDAAVAVEGIDEYLTDLLPRALRREAPAALAAEGAATVHLHATDEGLDGGEWLVDLSSDPIEVTRGHAKADAALRGPVSDLLLFTWGRLDAGGGRLQAFGSPGPLAALTGPNL